MTVRVRTPSVAELAHRLVVCTELQTTCGALQSSDAVCDTRQCGMFNSLGLQPSWIVAPQTEKGCGVNTGGTLSSVQV